MASKANHTDMQRKVLRNMDAATDLAVAYAAPIVPSLENKTPEGLLEDFGRLNAARKQIEKVEKIVKERLGALMDGATDLRGDNFVYKKEGRPRTALDQTKAKEKLVELGGPDLLEECMSSSTVETVTVKEIA